MKSSTAYHRRKTSLLIRRLAIILIVMTLFLLTISSYKLALASSSYSNSSTDYTYQSVVVEKGDTLWGIAAESGSHADINLLVHKTMQYNNLTSTYIQPGQVIYVPTKL